MPSSEDRSPGDDYFTDLSQQVTRQGDGPEDGRAGLQEQSDLPSKPKRMACVLCRRRKLKCDGGKPSCATCERLQHDCSYDEARRKSGPKRGYVKALEARLAQVETLLKTQDGPVISSSAKRATAEVQCVEAVQDDILPDFHVVPGAQGNVDELPLAEATVNWPEEPAQPQVPDTMIGAIDDDLFGLSAEEPVLWEMIGLGIDEPLPSQDVINELNDIFFDKVHASTPMLHRPRYYAAMHLAPHMRPPVCLRYAMWCNSAVTTDKYEALHEHFYFRARKYIQQDEMKGHGESMVTLAHCQTWALLAMYEFKLMFFPRAWMSAGRANRMAQMMGLHRMDGTRLEVKQCLPPPRDWTEREERRRTFWMCFSMDRYSSIGTGWPMVVEEVDILTTLPCDEEAYEFSKPVTTISLDEALQPGGAAKLSSFAGVVLMACLFGRNLTHLHRPGADERDDDLNGGFWRRHRNIDSILLDTALMLPAKLRLPSGLNDSKVVFMNMNIHTSTICLHQAAIFKAEKNKALGRVGAESKARCIAAASETANIMRQVAHLDLSAMNPFVSFSLYVAARVFVQYLRSRPNDGQIHTSLQFLLSAMHAMKRNNPLTESFLVQLDVDLEAAGLGSSRSGKSGRPTYRPTMEATSDKCGVTYGDQGLSMYTDPGQSAQIVCSDPNTHSTSSRGMADMSDHTSGSQTFELPNRQRTPPSMQSLAMCGSPPRADILSMDTPMDSAQRQTPSSSTNSHQNLSSHTSHSGYSPQTQHLPPNQPSRTATQENLTHVTGIFEQNNKAFATDLDMHSLLFSAPDGMQPGFVLPQDWSAGTTGLTPNATGLTPGRDGNGNEVFDMTDADWNQAMDGYISWDSGLGHDTNLLEVMRERRL